MTRTPDGRPTQHVARRGLRAGTGALGMLLLATGCGGGGGDASPTGSSAATASPEASLSPTDVPPVFTLHENFFPVPQADAADIPWDEVGPGWFLVDSHLQPDIDFGEGDTVRLPEAVGGLSLVSPEGEWYAARSFAGSGAAFSVHWAADGVWLMTGVDSYFDREEGDLVLLDLATGAGSGIATDHWPEFDYVGANNGVTVADGYSQEASGPYVVFTPEGVVVPDCVRDFSQERGDFRTAVAPDGKSVVCFRWRSDGRSDVLVVDLQKPEAPVAVDVFRLDPGQYTQLGWLSAETFLLSRVNDDGDGLVYFTYNLSTRKIADFSLPFTVETEVQHVAFDYESQVYLLGGWESGSLDIRRANGDNIATVDCTDSGAPGWRLSGTRLLTFCPLEGGAVSLVDLETGDAVGTWTSDTGLEVRAYGYPQHAS